MKLLLPSGHITLIDDEDYTLTQNHKWRIKYTQRGGPYVITHIYKQDNKKTTDSLHRMILKAPPNKLIDHKDGDGLNNHRYNLRLCTQSLNMANQKPQLNVSGYKGVYRHKASNKWHAMIQINYKRFSLGYFDDPWEAAQAYNTAALTAWGEYAQLNVQRQVT